MRMVIFEAEGAAEIEAAGVAVERVMRAAGVMGGSVLELGVGAPDEVKALEAGDGDGRGLEARATSTAATAEAPPAGVVEIHATRLGEVEGAEHAGGNGKETAATPGAPRTSPADEGVRAPTQRNGAKEGGEFACPEAGCERSFGTAKGLGKHRSAVHGTPGSSPTAQTRAKQKAAGGVGRVERDGLTVGKDGRVECRVCNRRIGASGYGTHMAKHDRENASEQALRPTRGEEGEGGAAIRRAAPRVRMTIPQRGSGNNLPGGYSTLARATEDSSSRGGGGSEADDGDDDDGAGAAAVDDDRR